VKSIIVFSRMTRLLPLVLCFVFLVTSSAFAHAMPKKANADRTEPTASLRVDPLLLAEAGEVWRLIASPNNPVWPGWDASGTPLLFYLPNEQDVLINHPRPPQGFLRYRGPARFPGGRIFLKDGPTLIAQDGQNTSTDVAGIRTLVVADTLSNLRERVSGLLQNNRPAEEKVQGLHFSALATDPYEQLGLVIHEAFHVFQDKQAPDKRANEMLLLYYPVLSVQNNVEFAQEATALAEALRATDTPAFRRAAVRWLALRKDRRSGLPPKAVEYEDEVEFTEGLAKYTEYRLFQVLKGTAPGPAMFWAQGFVGYDDLAPQRERLIEQMVQGMSGATVVNNDPYGTAPARWRLYFSGMAVGVMLDRLSPGWKKGIFSPGVSLTSLVDEALRPSQAELEQALTAAKSGAAYAALVESKTKLAQEGKARAESVVKEIEAGPGVGLVVDYSQLGSPKLGMAFTPFGITVVDDARTIFSQVPIEISFGNDGEVAQKVAAPLLRDTGRRLVRFRLPAGATRAEVERALNKTQTDGSSVTDLTLDLPGATIKATKAQIKWSGEDLVIVLLKGSE